MSNQTLRERFKIEEKNYATASRIIADTIEAKLIKPADAQSKSKKYATYIPFWAWVLMSTQYHAKYFAAEITKRSQKVEPPYFSTQQIW